MPGTVVSSAVVLCRPSRPIYELERPFAAKVVETFGITIGRLGPERPWNKVAQQFPAVILDGGQSSYSDSKFCTLNRSASEFHRLSPARRAAAG